MKHQYFGDVNDYQKYGILRALSGSVDSLHVVWMLTPGDGRSDGRFTAYLHQPEEWRRFDPELFDFLEVEVLRNGRRSVGSVESWQGLQASFWSAVVPDDRPGRGRWWGGALPTVRARRLVFFDPDNGVEVPSCPKGRKGSSKYVYWDELEEAWRNGASLLVYQHFPREARAPFLERLSAEFHRRLNMESVVTFTTSHVAFFLVPQPWWREEATRGAREIRDVWRGRIGVREWSS